MCRVPVEVSVILTTLEARRSSARLLRQVYEGEPLSCARCGGTLKLIAVIERPAVIQQLLAPLGLLSSAPSFRAPPDPRESPAADPPREWAYDPCSDDRPVADPVMG